MRRTAGEISSTGCFKTKNAQVNKTMSGNRLVDRKNSGLFEIFIKSSKPHISRKSVISIYHISLHILPEAFFIPINVYRVK